MANNLPGGRILSGMGGYLNVMNAQQPTWNRLDVATWGIDKDIRMFHKGHSGTLGAIATRKVAEDATVTLKIWWDLGNPPDSLLITTIGTGQEWGCGLQLGIGSAAAQAALGQTPQKFYLLPSGMLRRLHVEDSSEGNDDGIVTADATVLANSLLFLMPDQAVAYADYVSALSSQGQFSPYAQLTTMQ